MRALLGGTADGDAVATLTAGHREPVGDRPWVLANMVASADGATAVDGESRGLSGPADRRVFHHLRGLADVVMAAAGTVRADRYGPARPSPAVRAARAARGQAEVPLVAVVTRSVDLDWDAPLFTGAEVPTVVAAPRDADPGRLDRARAAGRLVTAGTGGVDLPAVLRELGRDGARTVLCEGGPGLIAQLAAASCLDELFLTVSPLLVAGDAARVLRGDALDPPRPLRLAAAAEEDGALFLRYLVGDGR
ncbi:MAG: dihydrofolate reductase family protein [Thermoleophilia bacterium]|nr:dihydrofolate reductase family protein [Thermoleophilia bacterium]